MTLPAPPTTQAPKPASQIISAFQLLSDPALAIPQYQRPYKWTGKHINQLFSDIAVHKGKTSYRLGTIVFHHDGDVNNIVDGQQRTISLMLATRALIKRNQDKPLERPDLRDDLAALEKVTPLKFKNELSKVNIHSNYLAVSRIVSRPEFTEELIAFLLHKCQVVTVALNDVSEAFQFFDSQNARGRDLEPHDLLKAYHLREFNSKDEALKARTVDRWEKSETKELTTLFAKYLYRIRNWSRSESARFFGKDDIPLFKGVNMDTIGHYPYIEQLRIAHHFVDHYNSHYERKIDDRTMAFPFHLDQIMINGRRFFEMTSHYQEVIDHITDAAKHPKQLRGDEALDSLARKMIETINSYSARHRTGDSYVRSMFDCLLIYYIDKFGYIEISRAIEKIFIWAYSLRLRMQVVQLASMDNYVLEHNLFSRIKNATRPADFINMSLPLIRESENNSTNTKEIEDLFKEMKYYEQG
jgi:hypothetical protein